MTERPEQPAQRRISATAEGLRDAATNVLEGNGPEPLRLYFLDEPDDADELTPVVFQRIDLEQLAHELIDAVLSELQGPNSDGINTCDVCGVLFAGEYFSVPGVNGGPGHCSCETCCTSIEEEAAACVKRCGTGTIESVAPGAARLRIAGGSRQ